MSWMDEKQLYYLILGQSKQDINVLLKDVKVTHPSGVTGRVLGVDEKINNEIQYRIDIEWDNCSNKHSYSDCSLCREAPYGIVFLIPTNRLHLYYGIVDVCNHVYNLIDF